MRLPVEPGLKRMNNQSPGAGAVAEPSPLVSPPAVSSWREVKYTLLSEVPLTWRVPLTERAVPGWNLTTTPGSIVRVTPEFTERPCTTYGLLACVQVVLVEIVPETTVAARTEGKKAKTATITKPAIRADFGSRVFKLMKDIKQEVA